MNLLYAVFMGLWRDSFGKGGYGLPIIKNRFVQHILAFVATFLLCTLNKDMAWYWCLWVSLWVQIEWALGHGYAYDVAIGGTPDEKMLKRYEKAVGYKFLCKIFPQDLHYGICFDYVLLAIRYTWPLIPICFLFNPAFLFLGFLVASLYFVYRHCPVLQTKRWCDVELYVGFVVGLFVAYL